MARFLIDRWSAKDLLQWESAVYHSIKLGFEGQVAKKFLNGIYYTETLFITVRFSLETPFLLEMSFLWPSQANIIISVYYVDHQMFSRTLAKNNSREQTFRKYSQLLN